MRSGPLFLHLLPSELLSLKFGYNVLTRQLASSDFVVSCLKSALVFTHLQASCRHQNAVSQLGVCNSYAMMGFRLCMTSPLLPQWPVLAEERIVSERRMFGTVCLYDSIIIFGLAGVCTDFQTFVRWGAE